LTSLDIGCGSLDSHKARGDVNLDLDPNPINRPDNFVPGDAHNLPFEPETFEHVKFFEVIEHVENPTKCIREIWRVLKPDGIMEVSTPNPNHYRIILRHLFHKEVVPWKEHIALWGYAELRNLLLLNGFKIIKYDYVLDADRERHEKGSHRLPDKIMHKLSLCHALTGRSVWIKAVKVDYDGC
jgi:2-polyprenyl-3-methyl-5-hydroxy-6-metoxy-1,4-benzoquinol methylase